MVGVLEKRGRNRIFVKLNAWNQMGGAEVDSGLIGFTELK